MNSTETRRENIIGYPVDVVNIDQALDKVSQKLVNKASMHVITLNPEMIIAAQKNPELSEALLNAELVIPDGVGIELALLLRGIKIGRTVPGIELAYKTVQFCHDNNLSVAFLGAEQQVLETMSQKLLEQFPDLKVVFSHNGFFSNEKDQEIVETIASLKPALLLVALGVPKQETWIQKHKNTFCNTVMIGVGGSFDVWAGKVNRAPALFRSLKLEWLYRISKEPFRIKRIAFALPYFVFQVFLSNLKKH